MEYSEFPAPSPFDQAIDCVWFLSGKGSSYHPQPVVPDGKLELLVHLGDPFLRLHTDGSTELQQTSMVAGQLSGPIRLHPGGWIDVVGVRLHPLGARAILALPLGELTDDVLSLRMMHPALGVALEAAASSPGTRRERVQRILASLGRFLSGYSESGIGAAVRSLNDGYRGSLRELAERGRMTEKTLQRRFECEVGLSPKLYQQVVRFRRAFSLLQQDSGGGARAAVLAGYFDQAHLIREFKRFAGVSPAAFFHQEPTLAHVFSTPNHTVTP
jgi:AraC-like DNA-binding protein